MKQLEIHMNILKKKNMKIVKLNVRITKTIKNNTNQYGNAENHANPRNLFENFENHKNHRFPHDITKIIKQI